MPDFTIESRSLGIAGLASHNFWVLRNEKGQALAELHGLATDRQTSRPAPIGTDEDRFSLRIWHYTHDQSLSARYGGTSERETYIGKNQMHRPILTGPRDEIIERWDAAVRAMEPLNAKDLDYPSYGFKLTQDTVNSNAAYRTLGEVMGLPIRDFPGVVEPGIDNRMVPPGEIEQLRGDYPVLRSPSIQINGTLHPLKDPLAELDPAEPGHPDHAMYQRALAGVSSISAGRGSESLDRHVALHLLVSAREGGLERIDHVAASIQTHDSPAGARIFAVQGAIDDPTTRRQSGIDTDQAIRASTGEAMGRLQAQEETPLRLTNQVIASDLSAAPSMQDSTRRIRTV